MLFNTLNYFIFVVRDKIIEKLRTSTETDNDKVIYLKSL